MTLYEEIAQTAYILAESRGFIPGHELEDWLSAEQLVRVQHAGQDIEESEAVPPEEEAAALERAESQSKIHRPCE